MAVTQLPPMALAAVSDDAGAAQGIAAQGILRRQALRESAARTHARALPIVPVRARGMTVEGADGRRYLDCLSGAGALALGHNHPVVLDAIRAVLDAEAPLQILVGHPALRVVEQPLGPARGEFGAVLPAEPEGAAVVVRKGQPGHTGGRGSAGGGQCSGRHAPPGGHAAGAGHAEGAGSATNATREGTPGFASPYQSSPYQASPSEAAPCEMTRHEGARREAARREAARREGAQGDGTGRALNGGAPYAGDARTGAPPADPALAAAVQQECLRRGLIVELGGRQGAVIRLLPPLTITDEQTEAVLDRLTDALEVAIHTAGVRSHELPPTASPFAPPLAGDHR